MAKFKNCVNKLLICGSYVQSHEKCCNTKRKMCSYIGKLFYSFRDKSIKFDSMNILIVDDHAVVRKGLMQILLTEYPSATITEVSDSMEALGVARKQVWDIILLDISMPGRNGVDVLKQIRAEGIKVPVLMLSMHPESQYAVRVLKAGASGFLSKQSATEELIAAVNKVLTGKKYITASIADKLVDSLGNDNSQESHEGLSDREMQVLLLIASGKTVSDIADEISLSVSTISTYRVRILEKLGLNNNAELTRYVLDNNLN